MQIKHSEKFDKVRYAGFDGSHRVTQWLPSPTDVENQFIGRVREGRVDPRGLDAQMRDSICEELYDTGFFADVVDLGSDLSPAEQLAFTLSEMREQDVPYELRTRFAQIATCTPKSDAKWALATV